MRSILLRLGPDRVRFFATNSLLADALQKIYGHPTGTLPVASPVPNDDSHDYRNKTYDVGVLGGVAPEQGEAR